MPIATSVREQVQQLPSKHLGHIDYAENPSTANYRAFFINITPHEQEYVDTMFSSKEADGDNLDELKLATTAVASQIGPLPVAVPLLPDFLCNHLNCTVDVHIPRYELYDNENVYRRQVWGTDVYTDDSDVVAILYHCGILLSTDPLAEFQSLQSAKKSKHASGTDTKTTNGNSTAPLSTSSSPNSPSSSSSSASTPEPRYAVQPDNAEENVADMLVVRLRILPPLTAYHGCFRHGYNSRSWTGPVLHDGASLSVDSVRWCRKCN